MFSEAFAWSARCAETRETGGDVRRMAHNPEVEGSNPSPATKARGPFSNRERAFCMWFVNWLCKPRAR
jgi:hypothetical protein